MIGVIDQNTETKAQETTRYIKITVYCRDKEGYTTLLLTLNDFDRVLKRGEKNKKDSYQPGWWEKFVHWFIRG
tara:strand:+ start:273 stop:491 length:219 start_codon:yes stop_codon:yes gene_type:complete